MCKRVLQLRGQASGYYGTETLGELTRDRDVLTFTPAAKFSVLTDWKISVQANPFMESNQCFPTVVFFRKGAIPTRGIITLFVDSETAKKLQTFLAIKQS